MLEVTSGELKTLPRWVRVAFSARCAQRVCGLFRYYWKDAPEEHVIAVERAVSVADQSARDGKHVVAAASAASAAKQIGCEADVRNAQRYDFLMLKRLNEIHGWDDESPIDPDLCGPIWPEGVPEKWPLPDPDAKNPKKGEYLDLTFDLPANVDDETAQQLISELYERLNDHYVAHGGSGLVLDNYQAFEPQPAEVLS